MLSKKSDNHLSLDLNLSIKSGMYSFYSLSSQKNATFATADRIAAPDTNNIKIFIGTISFQLDQLNSKVKAFYEKSCL